MSVLSEWLHRTFPTLFPRPAPKPTPPISPPKPVPPVLPPVPPIVPPVSPPPIVPSPPPLPSIPDDTTARALAAMNARRASKGLGPFAWDAGLATAAMELAIPLGKGQAQPHQGFPDRVRRNGWPFEDMGVKSGFGNTSEGITWGGRSPEDAVLILDNDPNPAEPHRRDFEDPAFGYVGISIVPNGPGLSHFMLAPGSPTMPRTLASAAVCGPDGNALVPAHVVAAAALGGGFTSIGGLVAVVDYASRRK